MCGGVVYAYIYRVLLQMVGSSVGLTTAVLFRSDVVGRVLRGPDHCIFFRSDVVGRVLRGPDHY